MGVRLLILSFFVLKIQPIFNTSGPRGSASDNRSMFLKHGLVRFPCLHADGTCRAPQAAKFELCTSARTRGRTMPKGVA